MSDDRHTRPRQLAPACFVLPVQVPTLPPATHCNATLWGTEELILVEPASPYEEEQARLHAMIDERLAAGARLQAILLTHHHPDHIGGLPAIRARYPGVPVYAHAGTDRLVSERVAPGLIDVLVDEGHTWRLDSDGPHPVELIARFTPGHAPGHLVFHETHSGIACVGDLLAAVGTILIPPENGHMGQYLASLQRLIDLDLAIAIPAHGEPITDVPGKCRDYIAHRQMREQQVLAGLSRGPVSPMALVPGIYPQLPKMMHGFAAESLTAHLLQLERDGRARRSGEDWALA